MTDQSQYDLVVIGAGTGGYVAAIRAAQLGMKVAVVEKQKALGGTCLIWGCIPTKALLEHAHALKIARAAKDWGLTFGSPAALGLGPSTDLGAGNGVPAEIGIDMNQVQARKDKIVTGLTKGIEFLFKKNKIEWVKGTARLAGGGKIEVSGSQAQMLKSRHVVVATGSTPRSVPGIEIDRKRIITSDEAIGLREVPKSVVVLGSGAVGVEFASIFRRFGSDVTLIELLPRIVPLEDEAVSAELEKSFRKQGVKVMTGARVTSARTSDSGVEVEVEVGQEGQVGRVGLVGQVGKPATPKIKADYLLVATGRGPVTTGLGAEEAGLRLDNGFVVVDQEYRTNVPGILAIGDVITLGTPGHPQLAHVSSAEGVLAVERLAGREARPLNYDHVPSCTYCDPEIGSVGLTEAEARERGFDVRIGTFPFGVLGRAKIAGESEGFVKIVGDKRYDEVLGVHMIGARSTELIAEATLALRLECTVEEMVRTIHAHPTMAEAIGEAAHSVHGAAIHL